MLTPDFSDTLGKIGKRGDLISWYFSASAFEKELRSLKDKEVCLHSRLSRDTIEKAAYKSYKDIAMKMIQTVSHLGSIPPWREKRGPS